MIVKSLNPFLAKCLAAITETAAGNMERASGVIILNDPETNYPIAVMEASLISSMRKPNA
jgi:ornithine cyclodeaminase/alanine dehydrogenase-like protein (mu-crystallin family)